MRCINLSISLLDEGHRLKVPISAILSVSNIAKSRFFRTLILLIIQHRNLMWSCPACATPLMLDSRQWQCVNHHCFDVAKEGYVNLLLANQKHSAQPGDNKLMINARREFLEQDYYLPMARRVAELVSQHAKSKQLHVHDAGCGEGYYLNKVVNLLIQSEIETVGSGSDISKTAIQKASKKYSHLHFAVASSFSLPKSNESVDAVLQIFAPSRSEEVRRILKPKGLWLQVIPGPSHLIELKQTIYDNAVLHDSQSQPPDGFTLLQQDSIESNLTLFDFKSRESLLMMTPFYWAVKADERLSILKTMHQITADFTLRVLQKST